MSKTELVELIAEQAEISKAAAGRALEAALEGITEGLKKEGKVALVGFGTFSAKKRAAREGINPLTKEMFSLPLGVEENLVNLTHELNSKIVEFQALYNLGNTFCHFCIRCILIYYHDVDCMFRTPKGSQV